MLPWQLILGEISSKTFIRQAGVPKRIRIWQFQLKIFNGNIVATLCANMIKIDSATRANVFPELLHQT